MGSQGKHRSSTQSHSFKVKAKNRVEDLQGVFCSLQQARKENRGVDVGVLEEQVNQMLREWKAELHEPTPSSSLVGPSPSSSELSSDMKRLLQLTEEDDDASSSLAACLGKVGDEQCMRSTQSYCQNPEETYHPNYAENQVQIFEEEMVERLLRAKTILAEPCHEDNLGSQAEFRNTVFPIQNEEVNPGKYFPNGFGSHDETVSSAMFPSPAAFLGPKCALWDCPRPAAQSDWLMDYCSNFHATLALSEGAKGQSPVVRPGGIDLKDGPLFSSLSAKSHIKAVGIPECEGAATSKSPWNAHELFDTSMLPGETIREWLFFDKPRRAFESGTRKQRSLPDHCGRGWHESRKQIMKDLGGLKRSYYMDPQPTPQYEWHLFEYELSNYDACALYRMELKLVNTNKKNSKCKVQHHDPVTALQNQIGRLPANFSTYDGKLQISGSNHDGSKSNSNVTLKSTQKVNAKSSDSTNEDDAYSTHTFEFTVDDVSKYLLSP